MATFITKVGSQDSPVCWEGDWVGVRGLCPSPRSPVDQLHVLGSRPGGWGAGDVEGGG